MLAHVACNAQARRSVYASADFLDNGNEGIREQHCPSGRKLKLDANLRVGSNRLGHHLRLR
jgi:hypothetical protein